MHTHITIGKVANIILRFTKMCTVWIYVYIWTVQFHCLFSNYLNLTTENNEWKLIVLKFSPRFLCFYWIWILCYSYTIILKYIVVLRLVKFYYMLWGLPSHPEHINRYYHLWMFSVTVLLSNFFLEVILHTFSGGRTLLPK